MPQSTTSCHRTVLAMAGYAFANRPYRLLRFTRNDKNGCYGDSALNADRIRGVLQGALWFLRNVADVGAAEAERGVTVTVHLMLTVSEACCKALCGFCETSQT